jgi:plastocyanin
MSTNLALFPLLALTALACIGDSTGSSATYQCDNTGAVVTVAVTEYAFTPSSVTVPIRRSVCWVNTGQMTHTVEDVLGRFSHTLRPGEATVQTFTSVENYGYHCSIHSTMTGTLKVT